jgi:hypothetical protein
MNLNDKVVLKSFLGKKSLDDHDNSNNYWLLIGEKGKIIEVDNDYFNGKVLVLFEKNLDELNLPNHNPIINSLWIPVNDLDKL